MSRAQAAQAFDGQGGRAAGGEHGVEEEGDRAPEVLGHLLVVAARDRGLLVALEAEVAHFGRGHELQEGVEHAQAGAKHRHRDHSGGETLHRGPLEGRLHEGLTHGQVAGGLGDRGARSPVGPGPGTRRRASPCRADAPSRRPRGGGSRPSGAFPPSCAPRWPSRKTESESGHFVSQRWMVPLSHERRSADSTGPSPNPSQEEPPRSRGTPRCAGRRRPRSPRDRRAPCCGTGS